MNVFRKVVHVRRRYTDHPILAIGALVVLIIWGRSIANDMNGLLAVDHLPDLSEVLVLTIIFAFGWYDTELKKHQTTDMT